jgi:glycosyltransferase involved in cell wall biosynthesis
MVQDRGAAVIVPMYNEAEVVGDVVTDLRTAFPLVICVDDGSTDGSAACARAAGATVLVHRVNLGQGGALQTGLDFVRERTDVAHAVTFDADGQHRLCDAVAMVEHARASGVDVVLGARKSSPGQPLSRRLLLSLALRYSRANSGLDLTDTHNGLRVLSRRAVETIRLRQTGMAHASELETIIATRDLTWTEFPVVVNYSDYSKAKGQSNVNAFNIVYDLTVAKLIASS